MLDTYKGHLLKYSMIAFVCVVGYIRLRGLEFTAISVSDACAVVGLVYLVIGLFRLVNKMRFFDSTKYGYKKLIEIIMSKQYSRKNSTVGTYVDYINTTTYNKPILPFLIIAVFLVICSLISAII